MTKKRELKLLVAIPSTQTWEADFGMSLVFMSTYVSAHPVPGYGRVAYQVQNKRGSILAHMRQTFVEQALKHGASHLLFIDSDQTFPRDTVHRLIAHNKQVVGANIATKVLPAQPTARNKSNDIHGDLVYTRPSSKGLEQVWRLGTGLMLIDMNIFKREGMQQGPWFSQYWHEKLGAYVGEDWAFCERLDAAGVKIWVDHDLSKEVGHIGKLTYGHDLVQEEKPRATGTV